MASYATFIERVKDIHKIGAIQGHLGWDQETIMPAKGSKARSEIMSWLAKEQHSRITNSEFAKMIDTLESDNSLDDDQRANVREVRRRYDKAVKLPSEFVAEFALARSQALVAWQEARAESDFAKFKPHLAKLIAMTNEKIDYYGVKDTRYDVLLDEYEFGMKVSDYDPLFAGLKSRLVPLLHKIMEAKKLTPDPTLPSQMSFPVDAQTEFCKLVSSATGFDFEAGRMDASTHPFSAGLWPGDTRFTTRFDEKDPFSCLYAVMHETGHALYEQGLDANHSFTPRGDAVSLGVHESQSRFWENQVGRTPAFWKVVLPWFKEHFPESPDWTPEELNKIANCVEPGFIRVEADEVTYNLHIMLRYELEKKIFNDNLSVDEIPETWNQMFAEWFGIEVTEDRLGCLQDIHWSMAAFGYFPTYTLGNLYAAQLLDAMGEELGDIDAIVESGEWQPMLDWLRANIHQQGSKFTPSELIQKATGEPPTPNPFINYVEKKYGELYNL
ncbi:MAG: carboxypeptidase M32 [Candidatus Thermoplasmatota archaeon]|nr:carboxypeptidase M32 [Candidatus Thermoplasmatota archaeon]MEC8249994.1 carboxypeptidase M32 [Candidatus Thermoplasmatota archaeon]MEC8257598.1 carboxypeptidase M32 [Candidatus Thermoplasmatota archaeon]MEC8313408.1 carboxypeptidase M32 [Candidatus Thermoplasmatota archaeon]